MVFNWWRWLKKMRDKWASRPPRARGSKPWRLRPQCESLEERTTPQASPLTPPPGVFIQGQGIVIYGSNKNDVVAVGRPDADHLMIITHFDTQSPNSPV